MQRAKVRRKLKNEERLKVRKTAAQYVTGEAGGERAWSCRTLKALLKTYVFILSPRRKYYDLIVFESSLWLLYTK